MLFKGLAWHSEATRNRSVYNSKIDYGIFSLWSSAKEYCRNSNCQRKRHRRKSLNHFIMSQRIRIKLKSYDYNLVDKSAEKIVKTVKTTGAVVSGPIPLPTHKRIYTVLRSPHVNKKSREQFQLCSYKRLMDIYSSTAKTVDALMKLELPSGVEVEIKVW